MMRCCRQSYLVASILAITVLLLQAWIATSFTACAPSHYTSRCASGRKQVSSLITRRRQSSFYNEDFDEDLDDNKNDDDDPSDLYAALRRRQTLLDAARKVQMEAWMSPPVDTAAFPISGDWVRRVAMDVDMDMNAPSRHAMVGGASGSIYLLDLNLERESAAVLLDKIIDLHEPRNDDDDESSESSQQAAKALRALYGDYDGGGVISIVMKQDVVASSGREGGVQILKVETDTDADTTATGGIRSSKLRPRGKIPQLESFVTSLAFDQAGTLWVGSFDEGLIRGYNADELCDADPVYTIQAGSGILSLSIADEIGCGVAATEKNGIILFSLQDGKKLATWDPFLNSNNQEFARTAMVIQNDEAPRAPPMQIPDPEDPTQEATLLPSPIWSVVVGGSQGSLHQRRISINVAEGTISKTRPFDELSPPHVIPDRHKHAGAIVCLASPGPQVLISGAQDGQIRVWNSSYEQAGVEEEDKRDNFWASKPSFSYALVGYKVWLGSLVVLKDNILVSDGADNSVVAQFFKKGIE